MSEWQCDHPGCKRKCVGCGGAVGLRAIGWHFTVGPRLLCPEHRPDPMPCQDKYNESPTKDACAPCTGEREAKKHQARMWTAEDQENSDKTKIPFAGLLGVYGPG